MKRQFTGGASALAIACALTVLGASPALAADAPAAPADSAADVSELVVTALKREERLRDIPTAATALGETQLRDLGGVPSLQSLLSNVPAVNFANTSNGVTSEVSIRGSGTSRATAAESGVGLYRNGAYLGGGYQGGRTFARSDFFDAAGIEVLRGVQGALNGRNAVGGAINIVSARPVQGVQTGYVTGKFGQNYNREGALVINQPLTENLALRVGVNSMKQDKGFFYNPVLNRYFDAQSTDTLRAQLGYVNGPVTANLLVEHSSDMLPGLMYSLLIPAGTNLTYPRGVAEDKYNMHWNSPNTAKMRTNYYEFVGGYDLDFASVTLTSSLRERHSQNAYDADATSGDYQAFLAQQGLLAPGRVQGDAGLGGLALDYSSILYNDLHIVGNKTGKLSWLGGVEYYVLNDRVQNILSKTPTGTTAASRSTGAEQIALIDFKSYAAYASLGYDITDQLNLKAEGRYTHDEKSIDSVRVDYGTGAPLGVGFAFTDGKTSSNFSYNVTLAYKIDDWLTYAKVGTAYRAGGFNLALGDPRAPKIPPATFDDENSTAYEIGAKGNITRNIFVTAAAYRVYVDNLLVQTDNGCFAASPVCPAAATNYIYNAGKARLGGIEVEANGRANILGGIGRATVGVSRQWGVITDGPDKGKHGPQRADWTGTFSVNYRHAIVNDVQGFINIKGNMRKGGVQEIAQTPPLHDFSTYDLRVGATYGGLEGAFFVNNFANESYIVFESPSVRRWNFPQTWGADLTYRW
jgi:iron complex outermembrane receptor protein